MIAEKSTRNDMHLLQMVEDDILEHEYIAPSKKGPFKVPRRGLR